MEMAKRRPALVFLLATCAALIAGLSASSLVRPRPASDAAARWPDLRERLGVPEGRWLLVVHTRREPQRKARYLGFVLERLSTEAVEAAVVTPADGQIASAAAERGRQQGRARLVLDDGQLATALGIDSPGGDSVDRLWLLASDDRLDVQLAVESLQDDELRQVLEKAVLGKVGGAEAAQTVRLAVGDPFPAARVREVPGGELVDLARLDGRYFVFFTAECTGCSLSAQLEMLAELAATPIGSEVAAVFSSRFAHAEVAREAALSQVTSPLYVSVDELPGIEDLYYSKGLFGDAVVAERSGSRVASLQSLGTLLEQEARP